MRFMKGTIWNDPGSIEMKSVASSRQMRPRRLATWLYRGVKEFL